MTRIGRLTSARNNAVAKMRLPVFFMFNPILFRADMRSTLLVPRLPTVCTSAVTASQPRYGNDDRDAKALDRLPTDWHLVVERNQTSQPSLQSLPNRSEPTWPLQHHLGPPNP